ncbi:MAG: hydrogenase maturation nickel metallochaperone HypA [Synergistaceae bacterium]|nr:hydrogenase maturation nickel metallochaperone HypA [Synergistaceae bacterium]
MHEVSLVESIVTALSKMMEEEKWKKINEVRLRVGVLRQVNPEIMSFAFETVTKRTPLEGARLIVADVPLEYRCRNCGQMWGEENGLCPACGSGSRETLAGMELEIESLEVEENS